MLGRACKDLEKAMGCNPSAFLLWAAANVVPPMETSPCLNGCGPLFPETNLNSTHTMHPRYRRTIRTDVLYLITMIVAIIASFTLLATAAHAQTEAPSNVPTEFGPLVSLLGPKAGNVIWTVFGWIGAIGLVAKFLERKIEDWTWDKIIKDIKRPGTDDDIWIRAMLGSAKYRFTAFILNLLVSLKLPTLYDYETEQALKYPTPIPPPSPVTPPPHGTGSVSMPLAILVGVLLFSGCATQRLDTAGPYGDGSVFGTPSVTAITNETGQVITTTNAAVLADALVLYKAHETVDSAYDVMDNFLAWEFRYRDILKQFPEIKKTADEIRKHGRKWLAAAAVACDAYEEKPTAETKSTMLSALAVLSKTLVEVQTHQAAHTNSAPGIVTPKTFNLK